MPSKFAPMANCSIPNSSPVSGPISTKSLRPSKRRDNPDGRSEATPLTRDAGPYLIAAFNVQRSTLNAQRSIQNVQHWVLDVGRSAFFFSRRAKGACTDPAAKSDAIRLTGTDSLITAFNAQRSTLNAQRSIQNVQHWALDVRRWAFFPIRRVRGACTDRAAKSNTVRLTGADFLITAFNAQRSTLNAQGSIQNVQHWVLDVRRSAFSFSRRVKGAWWPSRSSKPSLPRKWRGRFDSYPLRHFFAVILSEAKRSRRIPRHYVNRFHRDSSTSLGMTEQ